MKGIAAADKSSVPAPAGVSSSRRTASEPAVLQPVVHASVTRLRRKLLLSLGIGLPALALLTLILSRKPEEKPVPPPPPSRAGILQEIGTLEALTEIPVLTRFSGDIVWMIEEGSFVELGQPVVRFETKTIEEEIEAREKDLQDKKENVRRAQQDIDMSRERYKHVVRQSEIQLELAELERKRVYDYPPADERLDLESSLKSTSLDLQQFEIEAKGYEDLAQRGFVSDAVLKKKRLDLATKKIDHAKARQLHDLAIQGSTVDAKRLADMALADARKRLQITLFNRDADMTVMQANLELAKLDLANFERDLAQKRLERQRATVGAPARGRMAFTEVWKGPSKSNSPVQVGENRTSGSDLGTICDTSVFRVRVWLNEADVSRLRQNMRATVKLPAFGGRSFDAYVSELSVVATDKNTALSSLALRSAGEAFVNVVQAKLDFINLSDADRKEFRIGYTADVQIDPAAPLYEPPAREPSP